MPLELHADDGRGAGRKQPLIVLGEEIHDELFADLGTPEEFPLLTRLSDYYRDVHYGSEELPDLAAECDRASRRHSGSSDASHFLDRLGEVARELAKHGRKLYAVAD